MKITQKRRIRKNNKMVIFKIILGWWKKCHIKIHFHQKNKLNKSMYNIINSIYCKVYNIINNIYVYIINCAI